jgi:hypothetical protein
LYCSGSIRSPEELRYGRYRSSWSADFGPVYFAAIIGESHRSLINASCKPVFTGLVNAFTLGAYDISQRRIGVLVLTNFNRVAILNLVHLLVRFPLYFKRKEITMDRRATICEKLTTVNYPRNLNYNMENGWLNSVNSCEI